jgi:membrane protease YdiL (CAAX protease family)
MNRFLTLAQHGLNSPARYFKTEFFTFLYTFPGSLPLIVVMIASGTRSDTMNANTLGIPEAVVLVLLTLPFASALLGLFRQVRKQHGRHWLTLITPNQTIQWKKFLYAGAVWFGLTLITELAFFAVNPSRYTFSFQPSVFVPLVLAVLVMIPIQASCEEIAFRGYLMQQTALISKRVWQPLVSTSVFFALLHLSNPEVKAYGFALTMPNYVLIGLILGIATLMDDGLEIAMGAHTANNIFGFLLVSEPNSVMKMPTLFTVPAEPPTIWGMLLVAGLGAAFLLIMARKYQWGSFAALFAKIDWQALEAAQPEAMQQEATQPEAQETANTSVSVSSASVA